MLYSSRTLRRASIRPPLVAVAALMLLPPLTSRGDDGDAASIRPGHNLLEESTGPERPRIGDLVEWLRGRSLDGGEWHHGVSTGSKASALVFLSTTCPLAKRYVERLKRIDADYRERGVELVGVFPNGDETKAGIAEFVERAGFAFPILRDLDARLAGQLGVTMTPQVVVIDRAGHLAYRGALDDHRYENRVRERFLRDALDDVLRGEPVRVATTRPLGCTIHADTSPEDGDETITWARHIAPILQNNCQSCHRPGEVGPFSLTSYEEARRWSTEIGAYTRERLMPPWKAAPGFGDFQNDISLSQAEIDRIQAWVAADAPQGDPAEAPPSPRFHEGWAFGEPDLVVEMPEEYVVAPEGEDDYRHFVIPVRFDEDRFVEAIDVRAGNRQTVHHVLVYVDTSGKARELDARDPGPGYSRFGGTGFRVVSTLGGWAPGKRPQKRPEGSGNWLPKECDVVLQVHYYRTGLEERDRTKVGLYFSKAPRPVAIRGGMAIDTRFVVPPGHRRFEVRASATIDEAAWITSVTPHMHLIGREMKVTARLPDGSVRPLVWLRDWDFNWQTTYQLRDLMRVPAGTKVELTAFFDNSSENPHNPFDPPRPIGWGERTTEEMCIAFFSWLPVSEYDPTIRGRRVASAE